MPLSPPSRPDLPSEGYLHAGGHRLEYRWLPPARARRPALVLLHQGLGAAGMWRDFPERLAARTGCGVLLYSRYGYGGSDVAVGPRPLDFMEIEGASVLPEVLRAVGLEDVVLVGHSDGGTAALAYAGTGHPLRALAVVAPHVRDEPATYEAVARHRARWEGSTLRERLARHHADVDRTFGTWAEVWLSSAMRDWTIEPLLARITCPVLATQGLDDDHGTLVHLERIAALARGPVILEKLAGCGHDPFRDRAPRMLTLLGDFVARHAS